MSSVLSCTQLKKTFHDAEKELVVLNDVELSIEPNQMIAILGKSGSGKSTLLHLLGGLDVPSFGKVFWNDRDISQLSENQKSQIRNVHLGFIYQFHHLLPEFTALENVVMPLLIGKTTVREAKEIAYDFLNSVGLSERIHHKIGELSGGERQRVAIARALVTKPSCVLADEPTGNLDQETAEEIWQLMFGLQRDLKTSFVIVTHDLRLTEKVQQSYVLDRGILISKD